MVDMRVDTMTDELTQAIGFEDVSDIMPSTVDAEVSDSLAINKDIDHNIALANKCGLDLKNLFMRLSSLTLAIDDKVALKAIDMGLKIHDAYGNEKKNRKALEERCTVEFSPDEIGRIKNMLQAAYPNVKDKIIVKETVERVRELSE